MPDTLTYEFTRNELAKDREPKESRLETWEEIKEWYPEYIVYTREVEGGVVNFYIDWKVHKFGRFRVHEDEFPYDAERNQCYHADVDVEAGEVNIHGIDEELTRKWRKRFIPGYDSG